jgi:hydroxylamine reductase
MMEYGMHCMGCPYSQMESLEMGCAAHGMDVNELVEKLNTYLAEKANA